VCDFIPQNPESQDINLIIFIVFNETVYSVSAIHTVILLSLPICM